jgi:hypothetical protein
MLPLIGLPYFLFVVVMFQGKGYQIGSKDDNDNSDPDIECDICKIKVPFNQYQEHYNTHSKPPRVFFLPGVNDLSNDNSNSHSSSYSHSNSYSHSSSSHSSSSSYPRSNSHSNSNNNSSFVPPFNGLPASFFSMMMMMNNSPFNLIMNNSADVDNMTYEELLDLEERVGAVKTGF